jgi:arsenical pump membrane protein
MYASAIANAGKLSLLNSWRNTDSPISEFEHLGIVGITSGWLEHMRQGSPEKTLAVAGAATVASNVMNNLPAALVARSVLANAHAHTVTVLAALVGTDAGPMVIPFGSLATMLVLALARQEGEEVPAGRFVMFGLWAVPVVVVATAFALALNVALAR